MTSLQTAEFNHQTFGMRLMTNWKELCAELVLSRKLADWEDCEDLWARAEAELAKPEPDRPSEAFTTVQEQLDQLAGDQELMIYRWPDGRWTIEHTNTSPHSLLGEVSGEYTSDGFTLEQAVHNLAAQLPTSQTEAP